MEDSQDWQEPNYEQRLAVHKILDTTPLDNAALAKAWKSYLSRMLKSCGWNKSAINQIFEWGNTGHNWKALWFDDEFQEEKVKTFQSDLMYFSDRMSLDRLFRLHHHYNSIQCSWQLDLHFDPTNRSLLNN